MLGLSIGFNAVSDHATCTAVFVAVAAAIGISLGSLRTMSRISWLAWIGIVCILIASMLPLPSPLVLYLSTLQMPTEQYER